MRFWHRLSRVQRRKSELEMNDKLQLMQEIERAHMEWVTAQKRLDFVLEKEQIDYAVFALEAAEKRFEMLIKQAKNLKLSAIEVNRGRVMEG
ncbi:MULTISPECIES: YaaL family protein [Paenibacillus]|uniref:YaaL family protein n=1 Tax=Paenibacillus radicis (ex Xue et al. 2023) TaxID=2972489 RepID=A0ABT1YSH4_9BACL|nr:YaaL family protein [Paenibacillus radicis (ex Xue et al. 2023)]MCR8636143.1 YaaL family protein [Paenibacillus radicis (ex Xue et al. 2023)]